MSFRSEGVITSACGRASDVSRPEGADQPVAGARRPIATPGQQQEPGDSALGLYNYKARFYSTTLGRFLSVDPISGSEGDPQSWNPYAYVRNNPLVYVDPSGMCGVTSWGDAGDCIKQGKDAIGQIVGAGSEAAGAAGDAYNWVNGTLTSAAQNIDSGDVHTALDLAGMAPVVGEAADVANAALYAYEGDWVNAGLSLGSAIPVGGNGFTAARWGLRYGDEGFALAGFAAKHEDDAAALGIDYRRTDLSGGIKPYVARPRAKLVTSSANANMRDGIGQLRSSSRSWGGRQLESNSIVSRSITFARLADLAGDTTQVDTSRIGVTR